MLAKLRNHLTLALIFYALTLAQQYLFYWYNDFPIVPLSGEKYFGIYALFLLLTFIKGPKARFLSLSSIMILNLFQMGHLAYFGTQVLPSEYFLFFTEFHEIQGTLKENLAFVFIPLLFTAIPLMIGLFSQKKLKTSYEWRGIGILLILYALYNPIRTYITGNTWGRQPSTRELTGMNLYLTLSYFTGKILPHKLSQTSYGGAPNTALKLVVSNGQKSKWDKIIIVLGESLTPNHMQLFGYERETTPFLISQKTSPNFFHTIGLSGGVSTDISVAYFLNLGFGSAGGPKASKGDQCLFRLAKTEGFRTHFHSIQSSEQLRYISPYLCSSALDDYRAMEDISPNTLDHQAARDRDLLKDQQGFLALENKDFLMLHQRGSHSPWNLRFTDQAKKFNGSSDSRVDDYDNSVVEFDLFWSEFYSLLSKSNKKILVIYTSDHGESVGENGRWGHGFLEPASFEVPVLIFSFNQNLPAETLKLPKFLTHYNLGIFIAKELGHVLNQSASVLPIDYEIYGNDIDGFAGKATINFKESGYSFKFIP